MTKCLKNKSTEMADNSRREGEVNEIFARHKCY